MGKKAPKIKYNKKKLSMVRKEFLANLATREMRKIFMKWLFWQWSLLRPAVASTCSCEMSPRRCDSSRILQGQPAKSNRVSSRIENRGALTMVFFDRSCFKLFTLKFPNKSAQSLSCERPIKLLSEPSFYYLKTKVVSQWRYSVGGLWKKFDTGFTE
jgi:hypothetical protein